MHFLHILFSALSRFFGGVAEYLANPRSVMAEWEADKSACDWFCTCEHCEASWDFWESEYDDSVAHERLNPDFCNCDDCRADRLFRY